MKLQSISLVQTRKAPPPSTAADITPGYYVLACGRTAHVAVARQRTGTNWLDDGAVHIDYDDGAMTAVFFDTFLQWRPQRIVEFSPSKPRPRTGAH